MEKTNNNEKSKNEIKIGEKPPKNKINIKKSKKKALKIKKKQNKINIKNRKKQLKLKKKKELRMNSLHHIFNIFTIVQPYNKYY